jgi:osmotically-inducible protein OsmY
MDEHTMTMTEPAVSELDLRRTIEEALWSLDSIRVSKPALEVKMSGGQATVSGIVASPMMREQIEEMLRGLPVTLELLDDAAIQHAAAYTLATDPRTASIPPGYRVTMHNGHIHVKGKLTPEQTQTAQNVLSGVKGSKGVTVN